jgi:hypothetical protein
MDGRDLAFDGIDVRAGSTCAYAGGRQVRPGVGDAIEFVTRDTWGLLSDRLRRHAEPATLVIAAQRD